MSTTKRKSRRGGAGPYRKGAEHENLIRNEYEAAGWFAMRQPKSQSPIDILAIAPHTHGPHVVHFAQAKLRGKIRPGERQAVIALAEQYGGVPVLVYGKDPIRRTNLLTGEDMDDAL